MATNLLFDVSDPGLRRDPYPVYRRLRETAPAWRAPDGIWYFTRYQDCFDLFRHPALSYDFSESPAFQASLSPDPERRARQLASAKRHRSLLEHDPPEHTRLRSLINRAFTAPSVEASRPVIERYIDDLIDQFDGERVDLVDAFGSMLPILVICDMMGVHPEERHEFLAVGNGIARAMDPDVPLEEKSAAGLNMRSYIGGLIDARRDSPGDDLTTRLIQAAEDGRLATQEELVMNTGALLIAGFETTTNLITNAVYQLLRHPEELARLRAEPDLIRTAIEEVLRFDPPVQMLSPRTMTAATVLGGAALEPGDAVVPVMAAANRDPDEFADPDRFDIARSPNRHLSFGLGHHMCVGSALARMEAQAAVARLLTRFPGLALDAARPPEFRPNLALRGFATLPVTLT